MRDTASVRKVRSRPVTQLLTIDALVVTPSVVAERTLVAELGGFDEGQRFGEAHDRCAVADARREDRIDCPRRLLSGGT
jgi:hypothetical protein